MSDFIHPDLDLFRKTVEFPSFSSAAVQLGVQQPALTKLVGRLEAKLGHKLLLRSRQGFSLTHEGELLLERLKRVKSVWESDGNKNPQHILLAAHESITSTYFPKLLPRLIEAFPTTEFSFAHAPSVEVSAGVANGAFDLGLVVNTLRHADLLFKQVGEEFVGLWGKTTKPGQVILVHPDMLMIGRLMRLLPDARIVTIPSYETIASVVAGPEGWSGLLPNPVALRYGLKLQSERLFEAKLNLIVRKDKFPNEFFRKIADIAKESTPDFK